VVKKNSERNRSKFLLGSKGKQYYKSLKRLLSIYLKENCAKENKTIELAIVKWVEKELEAIRSQHLIT